MRGEFVDLTGARLYYYAAGTRGAGEPVVFLHGFPTSGHLWTDVVPLVPAGHRVVVLDLLGYGRSDRPQSRSVSLRAHAERVIELFDTLGINYACVVGHDIGGGIAQGPDGYDGHVTFYIAVPDVETALAKAESLGGTRVMGPERIMDDAMELGQFTDPEGHLIGLVNPLQQG